MAVKGKSAKGKEVIGQSSVAKRKSVSEPDHSENAGRRKGRQPKAIKFFDDEAMDTGSEEEEDQWSEEDFGENDFVDDIKTETKDTSKTGKVGNLPFWLKEEEISDDELENLVKDRYGRASSHVVYADESHDVKNVDKRMSFMHSMKDPTIWKVKCMVGRERHLAFCLIQKFLELRNLETKLQILSAFALDHLKGYIFIEAERECDVLEACKGFCYIYSSRIALVPKNEVPHLLSVQNTSSEVSEGMWVRMKYGNYKGDLAQVAAVEDDRRRAIVKLIPRIDMQALAQKFGGGVTSKKASVPAPRLIRSNELQDFRSHIEYKRDNQTGEVFEVLDGMMLKNGYLYKKVPVASLSYWDIQPSADEIQKFKVTDVRSDDMDWLSSLYGGGETSSSVKCGKGKDDEAFGITSGKGNGFEFHDFVLLDKKDFGVIIGIGDDNFEILKGNLETPEVVTIKPQEIKSKLCDKMFTALDSRMTTISIGDTVRVLQGPFQNREGVVRHMYRGTIFIHDTNQPENGGLFSTKSMSCEKINSKDTNGEDTDDVLHPPGFEDSLATPSVSRSPQRPSQRRDDNRSFRSGYEGERDRFSIGQTLRIRVGPLKGYLCRVVAIYRTDIRVKLQLQSKVITVSSDHLTEMKGSQNSIGCGDSFDHIGAQGLFKDGPNVERPEAPNENTGWNVEVSSTARHADHVMEPVTSKVGVDLLQRLAAGISSNNCVFFLTRAPVGRSGPTDKVIDSWNPVSSATSQDTAFAKPFGNITGFNDQKTGEEQGDDPWGSKANQASSNNATFGWEKGVSSSEDPWGSKSNQEGRCNNASAGWEKGSGSSADPWASKADQVDHSNKPMCGWDNSAAGSAGRNTNNASTVTNGWDNALGSSLNQNSFTATEDQVCNQETSLDVWAKATTSTSIGSSVKKSNSWGEGTEKGKTDDTGKDNPWSKTTTTTHTASWNNADRSGSWGSATEQGVQLAQSQVQADGWSTRKSLGSDPVSTWNEGKSSNGEDGEPVGKWDGWNKPKDLGWGQGSKWNKGMQGDNDEDGNRDESDGWNKPRGLDRGRGSGGRRGGRGGGDFSNRGRGDYSSRGRGDYSSGGRGDSNSGRSYARGKSSQWSESQDNSWNRDGAFSGDAWNSSKGGGGQKDSWNKGKDTDREAGRGGEGWKKDQTDGWNSQNSFGRDESTSEWKKGSYGQGGVGDQADNWNGGKSFTGVQSNNSGNTDSNWGASKDPDQAGTWGQKAIGGDNLSSGWTGWKMSEGGGGDQSVNWKQAKATGGGHSGWGSGNTGWNGGGGDNNQSDDWKKHSFGEAKSSSGWNKGSDSADGGGHQSDSWNGGKSFGRDQSSGWNNRGGGRGGDRGGRRGGGWDGDKGGRRGGSWDGDRGGRRGGRRGGDRGGERGGRRGGGRGGRGFDGDRGRGFGSDNSRSGWNNGDKSGDNGAFGTDGSSSWNNSRKGGAFGTDGSSWQKDKTNWSQGGEAADKGQWSSGWGQETNASKEAGESGGHADSWRSKVVSGVPGGGSSGWKNQSNSWNQGGEAKKSPPSSGWGQDSTVNKESGGHADSWRGKAASGGGGSSGWNNQSSNWSQGEAAKKSPTPSAWGQATVAAEKEDGGGTGGNEAWGKDSDGGKRGGW